MNGRFAPRKRSFHNHSFGESQNNQLIADDQSMLRRLFPVWPISTAAAFCRTAEALQHSMLAITMEQEFHFSFISSGVNPRRTQSCAQCSGARSKDPEKPAEPIGVGFKLTLPISSKPDPRLVALDRILARQAARDFIHAAWAGQESAASPIKEDF
jgi:hypothetical protein